MAGPSFRPFSSNINELQIHSLDTTDRFILMIKTIMSVFCGHGLTPNIIFYTEVPNCI